MSFRCGIKPGDKFGDWVVIGEPVWEAINHCTYLTCRCTLCGAERKCLMRYLRDNGGPKCRNCIPWFNKKKS